jgi:formylglycine-generating enzyme required for sulfatase activity
MNRVVVSLLRAVRVDRCGRARTVTSLLSAGLAAISFGCSANSGGGNGATGAGGEKNSPGESGGETAGNGPKEGGNQFACESTSQPGETIQIPAAEFSMGCNAATDTQCKDDEKPLHMVSLDAFEIDKTEVTQNQYAACVAAGMCAAPTCEWDCAKGDGPAACVHWNDAKAYCAWANGRLPSEAEWELAARGTDGRKFPWGNQAPDCDHVNMQGCDGMAASVGSHPKGASPYGVMDMAGNVVEMVADHYGATYYSMSPAKNPPGPTTGSHYVGRGGGFRSEAVWQRVSARDTYDSGDASASLGFRCAH